MTSIPPTSRGPTKVQAVGRHEAAVREAPWGFVFAVAVFWIVQAIAFEPTEPFFNNDETRHVMSGIFVRDAIAALAFRDPFGFAERYFLQYPALSFLTWPPAYYLVEGLWFLVAGTSMSAAKLLVALHASLAAWFVHRLAVRTHGATVAGIAVALLVVGPLFVELGRQVMLEMPTMAYALGSIWCAQRFLDDGRLRDASTSAAWAAAAALTRFDGFFVLAAIGAMVLLGARLDVLRGRALPLFASVYVILVLPYYVFMVQQIGWFHFQAIVEGTSADSTGFLAPANFVFYVSAIPSQVGWPVTVLAIAGISLTLGRRTFGPSIPWIALGASTYAMAVPVAELATRHTLYWTPVFALHGSIALVALGQRFGLYWRDVPVWMPAAVLIVTLGWQVSAPAPYMRGYETAARSVLASDPDARFVLFDGTLNGNFIYQVRRLGAATRPSVLRGDKMLYSVLSDPNAGYREHARTPEAMLAVIDRYDPSRIVVESRQLRHDVPAGRMLRELLMNRPDLFALEADIPLETSVRHWRDRRLLVYRKLHRNPKAETAVEFELWSIRRRLRSHPVDSGGTP